MEPKNPLENPRDEKEVFKELEAKYRTLVAAMDSDQKARFNDIRAVFAQMLRTKYGDVDLRKYRLHHLVNFSTTKEQDEPNIIALDLPGGDYEKFIRSIK